MHRYLRRCVKNRRQGAGTELLLFQIPVASFNKKIPEFQLRPGQFGVVIADESHLIKNREAKRTQSAVPLLQGAQVALCLSGTPATNRPAELFPQLQALRPEVRCTSYSLLPKAVMLRVFEVVQRLS
jgi:SNF2 family DNA or RNA helicase